MVGKRLVMIGISFAVLTAATVAPASAVGPGQPKAAGSQACAALTSDLTGGLAQVTGALQGLPPDLSKATGLVGTLVNTVQSLVSLGCLPDPLKAVPVPVAKDADLLPIPGLPGPSIPPCAAPAADLLSKLLGLVANLLKALAGAIPDLLGLINQVTGATTTVTDLTTSQGGAAACLPVAAPIKQ